MNNMIFLLETFIKDFKIALSYRLQFFLSIFSVFFSFYFLVIFSSLIDEGANSSLVKYGGNYFKFLFFGILVAEISNILLKTMPDTLRTYQRTGIFEELMLNGKKEISIILASLLYPGFRLFIRVIIYIFLYEFLIYENLLSNLNMISYLSILLFVLSLIGISLIGVAFTIFLKGSAVVPQMYLMLSSIVCGVAFPIELLPNILQIISEFFPTTHFLFIIRNNAFEIDSVDITYRIQALGFLSILFFTLGAFLVSKAINLSKKNGSLLFY
tara:strand:- start:562 stop:1371 length:810 start_codon:yes stop_codon:yes gene_type:complete